MTTADSSMNQPEQQTEIAPVVLETRDSRLMESDIFAENLRFIDNAINSSVVTNVSESRQPEAEVVSFDKHVATEDEIRRYLQTMPDNPVIIDSQEKAA